MARLTPDNQRRARDLIALYPYSRSALIPILHVLQEQDGYLSEDGMEHVGELLELTGAEVRGTATFYDMFHLEPVGKYLVAVCTNIACMLQGAYRLLEHAEDRLGVAPGVPPRTGCSPSRTPNAWPCAATPRASRSTGGSSVTSISSASTP